ncbi:MAG TPA: extracellular solute-binding protein, partial [Clostridiales bacterium]|nr:extracellular solute-binding protein [Clostridiales bacterium]
GINSALLSDLDRSMIYIKKMSKYPDEIALYRDELTGRDNSVLAAMSNFTSVIIKQNFSLDMLYIHGEEELPKANANIKDKIKNNLEKLTYSFTSDKFAIENEPEALNIWVNRAITHVDLLQKMVDAEFTPKTGIKVKISIMPDANKLTLATAANETPDLALGLQSHMPFELASRGALYDMSQFEDFWQVADRFMPGAFVPYLFNEGVYALPETSDFHALVYRTDVFDNLELTPPDTWQEVVDMLPVLQRYGKNFYHNISAGVGYKWFYQTTSMIFQNDGKLYTDDGLRTALDQPNSVKGIKALGDLFISYSLDKEVISFFNSFRYSILPVGIVDINEYTLIKNGAPELEGQWKLAPLPGTIKEDGSISRYFVANGTGGIIFDKTEKADDAWEFLKWWTEYETQVNYAFTLQSTFGKQFVWLSSNIEAVEASPFDQTDKRVIVEQLKWLKDVPRTPGQYILERSISDIWNEMVNEGESAQVAIDEKVIAINREIRKKMQEIGYYDENGNLIKPYVIRDIDWIEEQIYKAKQEVDKIEKHSNENK